MFDPIRARISESSVNAYNGIAIAAYENAKNKGFWEGRNCYDPVTMTTVLNLQRSEAGEFTDDHRKGHIATSHVKTKSEGASDKPCGAVVELADLLIRLADWHVGYVSLTYGVEPKDVQLHNVAIYRQNIEDSRILYTSEMFDNVATELPVAAKYERLRTDFIPAMSDENIILDRMYGYLGKFMRSCRYAKKAKLPSSVLTELNLIAAMVVDECLLMSEVLGYSEPQFWDTVEDKMSFNLGRPYKHGSAY